ncbi:MAG: DegV family protein [Anaerolineae bacterium]|nr:DegV family protein [Anaerolineae bacterium]
MAQIAVVTDSAACVPAELVRKYNIHVVPFELVWDGQSYRDGIDIAPTEFYRRLRESSSWPTTSQPALGDFATLYVWLSQEVDGIVSIHLSDELSATLQTARLAAEQASPVPVEVIDSRTGAIAEGFVVLAAARAAAAGGSLEEVAAAAKAAIPRVGLFITLETLEYLHRGGRIGEAAALLGSRLRIHPILYLAEGRVKVAGVARSRHKAMERLLDLMAGRAGERPMCVSVFHADALHEVEWLEARVRSRFDCQEFYITEFTPVMGAHTGPGAIGLAFCARQ